MGYLQISNLPIMWLLCGVTVFISALQAILFIRSANKATKACSIDPAIPKKAFRVGLISAIGPALGVFIVMVGLMSAIGGPMSWLRLSIIGAAATELAAATNGATAAGVTLGGDGYTLEVLAVSWFAMALNGAGWLLFTGVATPGLEKLRDKLSDGDTKWLGAMSAACSIGIFGYGRTDPRQYHHDPEERADHCCGVVFQSQQHRNIPRQAAQTGACRRFAFIRV